MADKKGAWLNQTKKVKKKAIQPKCRILFLSLKEKILSLSCVGAADLEVGDDDINEFLKGLTLQ
uniref:hypothetical protein n=1 Tax=Pseudomonas sp. HY2-MNA-CIBAN-0224 TaxID=3140471 RepID=UPI00331EB4A3